MINWPKFCLVMCQKNLLFSPGIEPGTFCVLDRCDNHYKWHQKFTLNLFWTECSKIHLAKYAEMILNKITITNSIEMGLC